MKKSEMIVHLTTKKDWRTAQQMGEVRTESLETEGFIHCSTPVQIIGVANHFYRGLPDLMILWIDPSRVLAVVRWEAPVHPSTPMPFAGDERNENSGNDAGLFPHIYGPINLDAIVEVVDYLPDEDGVFRHTPEKSI